MSNWDYFADTLPKKGQAVITAIDEAGFSRFSCGEDPTVKNMVFLGEKAEIDSDSGEEILKVSLWCTCSRGIHNVTKHRYWKPVFEEEK